MAFQQLASANPNDHEARLWIARLHARMGHQDLAEPVYRSVLLEDPGNVDAMLGVAAASWRATSLRRRLRCWKWPRSWRPTTTTFLRRLAAPTGRRDGRRVAIAYFERAVSLAPTEQHRLSLEGARRSYLHRVETRGSSEQFNGAAPDSRSGDLTVNVRLNDTWRVFGRGQVQRKFGCPNSAAAAAPSGAGSRRPRCAATPSSDPTTSSCPKATIWARCSTRTGPRPGRRACGTSTSRARARRCSRRRSRGSGSVDTGRPASMALRYALSLTEIEYALAVEAGHSVHLRGAYRFRRAYRCWPPMRQAWRISRTSRSIASATFAPTRCREACASTCRR